jgi:hypothetical protein
VPGLPLAVVDLSEVEHPRLHHTTIGQTATLHDTPVIVGPAFLSVSVAAASRGQGTVPAETC